MITVLEGDCRDVLKTLSAGSVQCVVTSPPYLGLRDYETGTWDGGDPNCTHRRDKKGSATRLRGTAHHGQGIEIERTSCPRCGAIRIDSQIGLEATPDEFVAAMVAVFREVRRVLADDGLVWLNLGDSFAGSWGAQGHRATESNAASWHGSQINNHPKRARTGSIRQNGLKPKDLMFIPHRVAMALQADGWWVRRDIVWFKTNPMPESVEDRCTTSHEFVFMLSKSERYFYDYEAIMEPTSPETHARVKRKRSDHHKYADGGPGNQTLATTLSAGRIPGGVGQKAHLTERGDGIRQNASFQAAISGEVLPMRNKRSVWPIASEPFLGEFCRHCRHLFTGDELSRVPAKRVIIGDQERSVRTCCLCHRTDGWVSHFAMFPPSLVEPCVLAGSRVGDTVLDPFGGGGTTALVADRHGRNAILIELNPHYAEMARQRIGKDAGLFGEVA